MKNKIPMFAFGLISGLLLMAIMVWVFMPKMMINVDESKYGVDQTVEMIVENAKQGGWKIPKIYDIQKSLVNAGYSDMTAMKIISLCQPGHAYTILREDGNKKVSGIMPCRIGVYESSDGKTYVSGMNIGLMSKMFGGTIETVMGKVAIEEGEMLSDVIK